MNLCAELSLSNINHNLGFSVLPKDTSACGVGGNGEGTANLLFSGRPAITPEPQLSCPLEGGIERPRNVPKHLTRTKWCGHWPVLSLQATGLNGFIAVSGISLFLSYQVTKTNISEALPHQKSYIVRGRGGFLIFIVIRNKLAVTHPHRSEIPFLARPKKWTWLN